MHEKAERGEPVGEVLGRVVARDEVARRCIAAARDREIPGGVREGAPAGIRRRRANRARRGARPRRRLANRLADRSRRARSAAHGRAAMDGVGIDVAADRLGDVDLARQRQRERAEGRIELVVVGEAAELLGEARIEVRRLPRARIAAVARSSMASATCCAASQRLNGSGSRPIRNRRSSGVRSDCTWTGAENSRKSEGIGARAHALEDDLRAALGEVDHAVGHGGAARLAKSSGPARPARPARRRSGCASAASACGPASPAGPASGRASAAPSPARSGARTVIVGVPAW